MKIFLRIIRVIFGVVLLFAFVYGLFIFAKAAPHTGDYLYGLDDSEPSAPAASVIKPAASQSKPASSTQTETQAPASTDGSGSGEAPAVEPAPQPTPLPDTPEGRALAKGWTAPPMVDINSWEYLLVNADNPLSEDYLPEQFGYINQTLSETDVQTYYNPNRLDSRVDVRIAQALVDFCAAAKNELGLDIVYLTSCYRSYASQQENFIRVCAANGVSDGKDANGRYITMPAGCSEHQSGLCADIVDKWYGTLRADEQENKPLQVWLREHCQDYGFILRFPEGKEDVTGVMYEPWHFRYVGVDAAKYIMENGITLEEFIGLYQ